MDKTNRKITKIAREAGRFTRKILVDTDLGSSEFELIRNVNKKPGITQTAICDILDVNKSAVTRMVSNLVKKGYIKTKNDKDDKRAKNLFPANEVDMLIRSSMDTESFFYEWLLEDIKNEDLKIFLDVLDKIHIKSKSERRSGFKNLLDAEAKTHVKT